MKKREKLLNPKRNIFLPFHLRDLAWWHRERGHIYYLKSNAFKSVGFCDKNVSIGMKKQLSVRDFFWNELMAAKYL